VEVSVRATSREDPGQAVTASRGLAAGLVGALRALKTELGLEGEVSVSDVARFPGVLEVAEAPGLDDTRSRVVLGLVAQALDGLERMRRDEGQGLADDLMRSLEKIEAATGRIAAVSEGEKAARRNALMERVRGLCSEMGLEETRLYQEVVRLVDRHDVAEELQRLRSHVALARELLRAGGACGKRLDFLAQELMREANTIGSKAGSSALVQELVDLKSEVERFREQVQNVE
jgi:uncharacterized protein (TIGR00255 family)